MIPLRPYNLKYSIRYPRFIILHSTLELNLHSGEVSFDKPNFQVGQLQNINYIKTKVPDLPYHFIVDKVGNDYQIITVRPIMTECVFLDIPRIYDSAIHISLIGNYNENIPTNRLYSVLCYRLLAPYCRTFRINHSRIHLHRELSNNPDETCPGEFFNKNKMLTILRNYVKKVTVSRN